MTKLPPLITVGPWTLRVLRDDAILFQASDGRNILAASDSERGYIALREDPALSDDQLLVDLMHELLHTILDTAGVPHTEHPESLIDILALGLLPVLRNNPELVRVLTEPSAYENKWQSDSTTPLFSLPSW